MPSTLIARIVSRDAVPVIEHATQAVSFDLSNACAGMLTGVFILQDLITRGEISCGMVVSGEYISHLSWNAAKQIRSVLSRQLASLTLGDPGAAVIVERAPDGAPGIDVIGFTTLAEHSRLCLLVPAPAYADFCDPLRLRLGIPGDRVAYVPEDLEGAYTAGPIAALQAAIRSGRLGEARTTMMLAAGAGITFAIALNRQTAAS